MVEANVNLRSMKIVMPSLIPSCWAAVKKCTDCGGKLPEERVDVGLDRCVKCESRAKKAECCCVLS
jgi:hypothetical protein